MTDHVPEVEPGISNWAAVSLLVAALDGAGVQDPTLIENHAFRAWCAIEDRARGRLKELPSRELVSKADAEILREAIAEGPIGWHAAAWALDLTRHHTFSRPWVADREVGPAQGDLFPICDWDTERRPLRQRMPRPWLTQRLAGELPHVRRFHASEERPSVVFDGRFFDELGFLSGLDNISVLTANASLDEFDVPDDGFPIRVLDEVTQTAFIETFIRNEVCEGPAELAMIPELAGTELGVAAVSSLLSESGHNAVALAGTRHLTDGDRRVNVASLVLPSGDVVSLPKRTPFWNLDVREGIDECDEPIRILVSADVRLAVLVCKDFLVPPVLDAVAHAGANLVMVPSMSSRLDLHDVAARQLAARDHALCVVANGPLAMGDDRPATALVGRPEAEARLTVATYRTGGAGRVARFALGSGSFSEH